MFCWLQPFHTASWQSSGKLPQTKQFIHSKATVKKKTSRKATSMCPTLPEIAACPARKIRFLRRQCALHGCKGFLPRTGVMSGTSAKCTFHTIFCEWYQAALGQPQWRNEGHQPGSLEMDTSGHSKATVKKKTSRKATSMCPILPEIAACPARKIHLLGRQCALHGCKGFLPRTGVMSGTSAKCTFRTIFCEWYQAALGQPQWRNEGHQPGSLEIDTSGHSKATVKKKTSRKATSMCPTLPEIAAGPARKIRLLRRQCALHGCKGFLPRTGVMSGTSAKCTFRTIFCEWYQAALGQPQWRNEGHQPGSLEIDTSGHSKATVKKKTSPSLVLLFFLGVWAEACSVWTSNQSAKFAPVPPTPCYKILGWDAPRSPWIRITDFNVRCHLTWKVVRLIRGAGAGSEAKSPAFCNGRHMAKKAQIQ